MRKNSIFWAIAIFGIIGTGYGGYSVIYSYSNNKEPSILAMFLLIFGGIALVGSIILLIAGFIASKKKKEDTPVEEEPKEEPIEEEIVEEKEPVTVTHIKELDEEVEYTSRRESRNVSIYDNDCSTIYVKLVGHGPILRIEGNRIVDMRDNTYYRIEGNMVMEEGSGPAFEIRGNQIRSAFGSYLYEISGSNINKVFGGFYASISGNYITIHDLSNKYEMTGSLSKTQLLVVAALLFGRY